MASGRVTCQVDPQQPVRILACRGCSRIHEYVCVDVYVHVYKYILYVHMCENVCIYI